MPPGHAHHVAVAFLDGARGGRQILDVVGVEDGQVGDLLGGAGEIEELGRGKAHVRHVDGKCRVGEHVPAHHVHEIDMAAGPETPQNLQALLHGIAAFEQVVAGDADADQEIRSCLLARLGQHFQMEAHAVLQIAAVLIGALVGEGADELIGQVAGEDELAAVEIALPAAPRRCSVVVLHPLDVEILHRLGKGAVRRLAQRRGRNGGKPVFCIPARAPAHMGQLAHQPGAMAMQPGRELLEIGNDGIVGD